MIKKIWRGFFDSHKFYINIVLHVENIIILFLIPDHDN